MAFDFPAAPVNGDKYADPTSGTEYVWTGEVWDLASGGDLTDYVLKEGDTMTGGLNLQTADGTGKLTITGGGSTTQGALVEFYNQDGTRKAYLGWGISTELVLSLETAASLNVKGGNIYMQDAGGIHYGSNSSVTDPLDFSKGICLYGYGGSSKFGFTITGGTLNYVVQSAPNQHNFVVGTEGVMNVKSDGVRIPGGNLNVTGTIQANGMISSIVAQGNIGLQLNDGARINLSNGCLIYKNYGSNDFMFHTNASQVFTFHISGTGDVFVIDTVGSTGNVSIPGRGSLAVREEVDVVIDGLKAELTTLRDEIAALKARK